MVSAVANILVDAGVGTSSTASGTSVNQGESVFAQLLDGMGEAALVAPIVTNTPVTEPMAPSLSKDDATANDAVIQSLMPMLAPEPMLVQLPVTPLPAAPAKVSVATDAANSEVASVVANSIPALIAKDTQASTTQTTSAPAPTATMDAQVKTETKPDAASTFGNTQAGVDDSTEITPTVDLQWLRAMTGNARGKAQPTPAAVNTTASNVTSSIASLPLPATQQAGKQSEAPQPGHDLDSTPSQSLIQLLAQAAPVMAANNREDKVKTSDAFSSSDVPSIAPANTQPTGTALADTSALNLQRQDVHASVGSHAWATELGNKLTMMATRDTQSATLYMTPADLGPVQVRIDMNNDQASVWFTAEHPETRSALEQALPRLREMFTAQGMSLTDAGVFGNRSQQQSQPQPQSSGASSFSGPLFASDEALAETATVRSISLSMLDAYA